MRLKLPFKYMNNTTTTKNKDVTPNFIISENSVYKCYFSNFLVTSKRFRDPESVPQDHH